MKKLIVSVFPILFLLSCKSGTADNKAPKMANEMCDCFSGFQKDMSPDAIALLKAVAESDSPRKTMQEGLTKMKPEESMPIIEKFKQVGDRSSSVNKCMQAFDEKHAKETTADKNALLKKLRNVMKSKTDCQAGAAIINIGLEQQGVK